MKQFNDVKGYLFVKGLYTKTVFDVRIEDSDNHVTLSIADNKLDMMMIIDVNDNIKKELKTC